MEEREQLMRQLDRARNEMRTALAGIDPQMAVTPEWSVKELLAHMAGWEAVTRDALRAHAMGAPPVTSARGGIDAYNDHSVAARRGLSYEQAVADWEQTLDELTQVLAEMPAEKLGEKLIFPWGPRGTVARIVGIIAGHEEEHARELQVLRAG